MSSTIAVTSEMVEDGPALVLPAEQAYITETPTGLVFSPDTPLAVWAGLVTRLQRQQRLIDWALADAINFGEHTYGEMYAQWVNETGLSKRTLQNIAYVGRKVESSRRREHVSFSHHAEVARLDPPDQNRLLDAAESAGWTRYELRDAVRNDPELAKRRAEAMVGSGESEAVAWHPTTADLTDEARAALDAKIAELGGGRHRTVAEAVWVAALYWADVRDAFTDWRGPS